MSFNTAISGLNAAHKRMEVAGNNIANVGTTGFKSSRAEFSALYSSSTSGGSRTAVGDGVQLANVSQDFSAGDAVSGTGNALDMRIQGKGFFVMSDNGVVSYTRSGTFHADAENYIVDAHGSRLQGYGVSDDGKVIAGARTDLKIESGNIAPRATGRVERTLNLDAAEGVISSPVPTFDPANITTYNTMWSAGIFDSLGNQHLMTQYFVKDGINSWKMHLLIDGRHPQDPGLNDPLTASMMFNANGSMQSLVGESGLTATNHTLTLSGWVPAKPLDAGKPGGLWGTNGATGNASGIVLDLNMLTQHQSASGSSGLVVDGYTAGQANQLSIDKRGVISMNFSNGLHRSVGQVMLASFANEQGLHPISDTRWLESYDSGVANYDTPGAGNLGGMVNQSLESSNVKLTEQLVELIQAQTAYQANSKTLSTEAELMQTLIRAT